MLTSFYLLAKGPFINLVEKRVETYELRGVLNYFLYFEALNKTFLSVSLFSFFGSGIELTTLHLPGRCLHS